MAPRIGGFGFGLRGPSFGPRGHHIAHRGYGPRRPMYGHHRPPMSFDCGCTSSHKSSGSKFGWGMLFGGALGAGLALILPKIFGGKKEEAPAQTAQKDSAPPATDQAAKEVKDEKKSGETETKTNDTALAQGNGLLKEGQTVKMECTGNKDGSMTCKADA